MKKTLDVIAVILGLLIFLTIIIINFLVKNYWVTLGFFGVFAIYKIYVWWKDFRQEQKLIKKMGTTAKELEKDFEALMEKMGRKKVETENKKAKCKFCGKITESNENLKKFKRLAYEEYDSYCCDNCYIKEMDEPMWNTRVIDSTTIEVLDVKPGNLTYNKSKERWERTSTFILKCEVIPQFDSFTEKKLWTIDHKDNLETKFRLFLDDYIDKYFNSPQRLKILMETKPIFESDYDVDMNHIKCAVTMWEES